MKEDMTEFCLLLQYNGIIGELLALLDKQRIKINDSIILSMNCVRLRCEINKENDIPVQTLPRISQILTNLRSAQRQG